MQVGAATRAIPTLEVPLLRHGDVVLEMLGADSAHQERVAVHALLDLLPVGVLFCVGDVDVPEQPGDLVFRDPGMGLL